jgi:DNA-binding NarL/FixJ family response regulator
MGPMREVSGSQGLVGSSRPLGVVIVESLALVRTELAQLLRDQPDMELLAEVGSVQEAVAAVRPIHQSRLAVVVSLGLTDERGSFWLIRSLRERFPVATIIACGGSVDPATISRALFVGADGYVDEGVDPASFVEAMRAASAGEIVLLRPGDRLVRTAPEAVLREELEDKLTVTELGVLAGAARGLSLREIGWSLGLADRTVRSLLRRIYAKLGVAGPLAALRMAVRSGLVTVAAR